jgi:hypothetical protein
MKDSLNKNDDRVLPSVSQDQVSSLSFATGRNRQATVSK